MAAHTFNPSTWEAEAGGSEFKASLVYRVSSRTGQATQRNLVSQKKKRKERRKGGREGGREERREGREKWRGGERRGKEKSWVSD